MRFLFSNTHTHPPTQHPPTLTRLGVISGQYFVKGPASRAQVSVTVDGVHAAGSPFALAGPLSAEMCACPRPEHAFMHDFGCSTADPAGQIHADMTRNFPDGITRDEFDSGLARAKPNGTALVHFSIVDNVVYSKNYGKYVIRLIFSPPKPLWLPTKTKYLANPAVGRANNAPAVLARRGSSHLMTMLMHALRTDESTCTHIIFCATQVQRLSEVH